MNRKEIFQKSTEVRVTKFGRKTVAACRTPRIHLGDGNSSDYNSILETRRILVAGNVGLDYGNEATVCVVTLSNYVSVIGVIPVYKPVADT